MPDQYGKLTEREKDVVRLYIKELTYEDIANRLGISMKTVTAKLNAVRDKMRTTSIKEAVERAKSQL